MLRYPALRTNGGDKGEPVLIKQCPDEVSRDLNSDVLRHQTLSPIWQRTQQGFVKDTEWKGFGPYKQGGGFLYMNP